MKYKSNKVCIFGNVFNTYKLGNQGGGENQLYLLATTLNSLGFEVKILDASIKSNFISHDGIEFCSIHRTSKILDKVTKKLFIIYKDLIKIDCDYYISSMMSYQQIIPLIVAIKKSKKFYYWVAADLELESIKSRIKHKYLIKKFSLQNLFSFFLDEVCFPFVKKYADIVFVQHANQLKNIGKNGKILKNVVLDLYKNVEKSDYFIWVGSIDYDKGFPTIEKLLSVNENLKIKIIGRIRDHRCTKIINRLRSNKNVEYLGYIKEKSDILNYIAMAKGLINTSPKEGFPITFLEAWSQNTPVISLNVDPGNIINKHRLGYYADGDKANFFNIFKVFDYSNYKNIREYCLKNHSVETFKENIIQIFN